MSPLELALYNTVLSIPPRYWKSKRVSSLIMSTTPVVKRALPPYYSGLACVQAPQLKSVRDLVPSGQQEALESPLRLREATLPNPEHSITTDFQVQIQVSE